MLLGQLFQLCNEGFAHFVDAALALHEFDKDRCRAVRDLAFQILHVVEIDHAGFGHERLEAVDILRLGGQRERAVGSAVEAVGQ